MTRPAQHQPGVTLWVFEDQLTLELPTLRQAPGAPVLLIESDRAFRMPRYHKKRLTFLVSAMRHFARELETSGRTVAHYPLQVSGYRDSLGAIRHHIRRSGAREFWVVEPSEHHTRVWLDTLPDLLGITIRYFPNTLFLTDRAEFARWARGMKAPVMETFYRRMRKQHDVLMDGAEPVGGAWNLDKENRKPFKSGLRVPPSPAFEPDEITRQVMAEIERRYPDHPGSTDGFVYPVTRRDALTAFDDFLDHRLPHFGDYEDAMVTGEPVLFHSNLSAAMNAGLLRPMEMIRAAEDRYVRRKAPLNAVEGFVRQILGWREYVYGIYHAFMPEYRDRNSRGDDRPLPAFFWNADTDMNCLRQCVAGVIDNAYSHHIQRLMVICNFATLAGLSPQAVTDWFLEMYIDSHDWVVTPNVIGMAMNADAPAGSARGTMATKPYVSSAAYINRMSDYCKSCKFDHTRRTGEGACPFNYLYWTFLDRHRSAYAGNMRMKMVLKNLDRFTDDELAEMRALRESFPGERDA